MTPIPRFSFVIAGIYRSPLPLAREIAAFAAIGGRAVLDLTRRDRPLIARACRKYALEYHKAGMPYDFDECAVNAAVVVALVLPRPLLVHCFHGRDRTGAVVDALMRRLA